MLFCLTYNIVLQRRQLIGITTSNRALAERDTNEMLIIYKLFGLNVDHLGHNNAEGRLREAFQSADVLYFFLMDCQSVIAADQFHGRVFFSYFRICAFMQKL